MAAKNVRSRHFRVGLGEKTPTETVIRIFLALIFSLMSVLLLLLLMLHLPPVQEFFIEKGVRAFEEATAVRLRLSGFRWWPFSRLVLNDVVLVKSDEETVSSEQVVLSYRLRPYFPFFEPKSAVLRKAVLNLTADEDSSREIQPLDSKDNVQGTAKSSRLPLPFPLTGVAVEAGAVQIRRTGHPDPLLSLRDLNGHLEISAEWLPSGPDIRIQVTDLRGQVLRPDWGDVQVLGSVRWRDGLANVDFLEVALGPQTRVVAHGAISVDGATQSNLDVQLSPWDWTSIPNCDKRLAALGPVVGTLRVSSEGGQWKLEHWLESHVGKLQGAGSWSGRGDPDGTLQWSATFAECRLPETDDFPRVDLNGAVQLSISGFSTKSLVGHLECQLDKSSWAGEAIDKAVLSASFENGHLILKSLDVRAPLGKVAASGMVDVAGLWDSKHRGEAGVKLEVSGLNLHKVFPTVFPQQTLDSRMTLQANHDPGLFRHWEKWQGKMDLYVNAPKLVTFSTAAGYQNQALDMHYSLNGQSLEILGKLFPEWAVKGQVDSQGDLRGHWPNLYWDGTMTFRQLQYQGAQCEQCVVKGRGAILGKRADRELVLQAAGVSVNGQTARNLRIEADQKDSACSIKLTGDRIGAAGSLQLSANTLDLWALPARFKLATGRLAWQDHAWSIDGQIAVDREEVVVDALKLRQDQQEISILGKMSWTKENRLQLNWDKLKVEQLLGLSGVSLPLSGISSGSLQLNGFLDQPKWNAECKLTQGKLYRETISESVIKLAYGTKQLSFTGSLQSPAAEASIAISGQIPAVFSLKPLQFVVLRDEPWSSTLQVAGFKMESLVSYIPALEKLSGRMGTSTKLAGTLSRPEISGTGVWTDGSLQLKAWPHAAQNIHLEWQGDGQQIVIRNTSLDILGGRATASGNIKLGIDRFPEISLHAAAQQIEIPEIYGITGNGSGQFDLNLKAQETKLGGTFQFTRLAMNLGEFESDLARNIQVVGDETDKSIVEIGTAQRQRREPSPSQVAMDLELKTPSSGTWVKGKGLEAEVTGAVRLKKDGSGPLKVFGSLRSVRGTYTFQGHRLVIVEGELAFLGVTEPIPTVQVLGQKSVQGVTIQVRVTGPLSQPKLLLSSIPTMNQVDILSYLLYGRPATQLSSKENQGLQQNAAVFFGSEASREFKRLLGNSPLAPDVLQLSNSQQGGGGVVEIGKYITPDLYVTYEKGLTSAQGDQIQMEYRFNRHLSIQSQFNLNQPSSIQTQLPERNQSGVDVLWRYDFGD